MRKTLPKPTPLIKGRRKRNRRGGGGGHLGFFSRRLNRGATHTRSLFLPLSSCSKVVCLPAPDYRFLISLLAHLFVRVKGKREALIPTITQTLRPSWGNRFRSPKRLAGSASLRCPPLSHGFLHQSRHRSPTDAGRSCTSSFGGPQGGREEGGLAQSPLSRPLWGDPERSSE